jgi:hypothetical protein
VSEMSIVRDYPYPVITVWRALTDPALVPLWTSTGQGGRPEGFKTEVGTRFRFIGKPFPGWDGIVRCEVLGEIPGGTRLTWEHTGFHGIEGAFMSQLLGRVRRKMLSEGLPAVLTDIGDDGHLRPGSTLRARP